MSFERSSDFVVGTVLGNAVQRVSRHGGKAIPRQTHDLAKPSEARHLLRRHALEAAPRNREIFLRGVSTNSWCAGTEKGTYK